MSPALAAEVLPIDVPQLIAVSLGMMVVLIPILGLTLRFAAKPLIEVLLRAGLIGASQAAPAVSTSTHELLVRRVVELEQEVERLKRPTLQAGESVGAPVARLDAARHR